MALLVRAALLLAWATVAAGQYDCPSGWTAKSGSPNCLGSTDASCTNAACCNPTPTPTPAPTPAPETCATHQATWILAQALGGGCRDGGATKFFDNGKLAETIASPFGNPEITAACCTLFADATCFDWPMLCPLGTTRQNANSAPGGGTNGMTLSQSDFETTCCTQTPLTCATFQVAWLTSQLLQQGCHPDGKFFDTKLSSTSVSSNSVADVKAACCTPFADALCSDWVIACNLGFYPVGTSSAPADSSDGTDLSQSGYQAACCREPLACANYGEMNSAFRGAASIIVAATGAILAMMRA